MIQGWQGKKNSLSWYKKSRLMELLVARTTARTAAVLVGANTTTETYYFQRLRQLNQWLKMKWVD